MFRGNPAAMIRLTNFAAQQGHQFGSVEHIEAAKKLFFETLTRLEQQAGANERAATPTPATEPDPMPPNEQPPAFFAPPPAPQPRSRPSRASVVSAPVSRELPGNYRSEFEADPKSVRLSPSQLEAAAIAGVSPRVYAENLLRMERMKRDGSFNNQ
jgi:hypothetical protein